MMYTRETIHIYSSFSKYIINLEILLPNTQIIKINDKNNENIYKFNNFNYNVVWLDLLNFNNINKLNALIQTREFINPNNTNINTI